MKPSLKLAFKPLATPLAMLTQASLVVVTGLCARSLNASVPLAWDVEPRRATPAKFDRYHGETLDLTATFRGFGELPFAPGADVRLYFQTNGMGSAWWNAPASVSSNVVTGTFSPSLDPGADSVTVFFGAPSNAYASAIIKLRPSPGFSPAAMPAPGIAGVVSLENYYTKDETDAAIDALSSVLRDTIADSTPGDYETVSNKAMSAVQPESLADKRDYSDLSVNTNVWLIVNPNGDKEWLQKDPLHPNVWRNGDDSRHLVWSPSQLWYFVPDQHHNEGECNYDRSSPHTATSLAFSFDYTGIQQTYRLFRGTRIALAEEIPSPPDLTSYATKTELGGVSETANAAALDAASALRIVLGERVWFAVTNYMRTAEGVIPSLQLWEVRDSVTNLVYDSREEITNTVKALTRELHTELTNRIHDAEKTIPSKAWGNYQSDGTDNPEPGKVAIVNQPTVILTGGGTFNKYVEIGDSSIWVLQSSGPVTFGGNTNGNYFAVLDDEGNPHFRVAKTDSYDLPAFISGILPRQSQNHILIYTATTNRHGNAVTEHPTISVCSDLKESVWHEEVDGEIDALGISVSWTRDDTIPAWVATVTPDNYPPKLYFRCKVVQEGGVAVINTAPVRFDGGVQFGNGTYRLVPYTTGGKTYLTVEGLQ